MARAEKEVQTFVLVGATGDLARRKLFPELHALEASGSLPKDFRVVAAGLERFSRSPALARRRFLARLRRDVRAIAKIDTRGDAWKKLESRIVYQRLSSDSVRSAARLARRVDQVDRRASASGRARAGARSTRGPPAGAERQRLVYLALPPSRVQATVEAFGATRFAKGEAGARTRFIVEKPYGRDLRTARSLDRTIERSLPRSKVLLMDHYLGKEGVDDLHQLRRSNPALEAMWNAGFVERVEISAREKIGIEGRGSFYEETGALRDFVQGHLIQLLTVTGMDLAPDGTRAQQAKSDVVRHLRRFNPRTVDRDVVRMQYDGYRAEPGVAANSNVLSPALARQLRLPADKPAVLEVALDPRASITLRSAAVPYRSPAPGWSERAARAARPTPASCSAPFAASTTGSWAATRPWRRGSG